GALLYVLSPVDLLPDPVLLDDIGVLLLALRSLHAAAEAAGVGKGKRSPSSREIEADV
ncbi:membrane protein, partial [Streptomyces sp. NRRL WC-3753]